MIHIVFGQLPLLHPEHTRNGAGSGCCRIEIATKLAETELKLAAMELELPAAKLEL
jgi:hypothetical protein